MKIITLSLSLSLCHYSQSKFHRIKYINLIFIYLFIIII